MPGKVRQGQSGASRVAQGAAQVPRSVVCVPPRWESYELLDSGDGGKLERFGPYTLVRPDTQAIWTPRLGRKRWEEADALFERGSSDEQAGTWRQQRRLPEQWQMEHEGLRFWVRLTPFRHTGVFPEHSAHWHWLRAQLARLEQPRVLMLFGYTGLQTLVAAQAGAQVCHVDASKPATRWARANQELSGYAHQPIRWIVDDVGKFVAREIRRKAQYDVIVLDPPVFGRGPKGEVWRLSEGLQALLRDCVQVLSERAVGVLLSAYATNISPLTLHTVLGEALVGRVGQVEAGEMVLVDTAMGRPLPAALYARWTAD